ncbi:hypothetical protein BP6252_05913 [Coleophoma cylindrospora]|uniref:SnoaL-like domain-containing protein n=1 Tax=Coleophoma cylindrospora TaxID=1849047 RepID=A0A3D8RLU6_9HELO|nr:hypothetical protein BP6252_05913 [Coleophoma cylindrospora]
MYFLSAICAVLVGCSAATTQSPTHEATNRTAVSLIGNDPISFFDLPVVTPVSPLLVSPSDVETIRRTLSRYSLAIDGKNFAALSLIFTSNAVANYSAPLNVLTPLTTIQSALEASLMPVTTQHLLGTQFIDILSPTSAFSVSYFTATHFGKDVYLGEIVTAYGQYQDMWIRQKNLNWKITHRNLLYMGPLIGNLSIFLG